MKKTKKKQKKSNKLKTWADVDKMLQSHGIFCGMPILMGKEDAEVVGDTRDRGIALMLTDNGRGQKKTSNMNTWSPKRSYNGLYVTVGVGRDMKNRVIWDGDIHSSPHIQRLEMWMETGAQRTNATLLTAEKRARKKLKAMVSERQWFCYEIEGAFVERSKRSGLIYFLRRGRPTIVIREDKEGDRLLYLCALCMHPLGYYKGSWAGALAPSDEVIAHLLYIRGNEYQFWKKANQIPLDDPRSGV